MTNKKGQIKETFVKLILLLVSFLVVFTACSNLYGQVVNRESTYQAEKSLETLRVLMNNVDSEDIAMLSMDDANIYGYNSKDVSQQNLRTECYSNKKYGKKDLGCICVCKKSTGCSATGVVKCYSLDYELDSFKTIEGKVVDDIPIKVECKITKKDKKISVGECGDSTKEES